MYKVAQRSCTNLNHHIDAKIQDKVQGCNFYVTVKYSLQISSVLYQNGNF